MDNSGIYANFLAYCLFGVHLYLQIKSQENEDAGLFF